MKHYINCTIDCCDKKHKAKGLCELHYQRLKKTGNPTTTTYKLRGAHHGHPLRAVYFNMISRCYNKKNPRYKDWGGRGITVCERWYSINGFKNFIGDMGDRPKGYSLDRIDVNGDYSPTNCRWIDKYTQASNTQKKHLCPGVDYMKNKNSYRARIKINGKEIHLGLFKELSEAINCRKLAEKKYLCTS